MINPKFLMATINFIEKNYIYYVYVNNRLDTSFVYGTNKNKKVILNLVPDNTENLSNKLIERRKTHITQPQIAAMQKYGVQVKFEQKRDYALKLHSLHPSSSI